MSRKGEVFPQLMPTQDSTFTPDVVICRNEGSDGQAPVWKCQAHLDAPLQFQKAHVSCEGWSGPGDVNIVPGSCLLEFKIAKPAVKYY